ncbi:dihydrolipoamide acetyltransferase (plasmid) [Caballeronia insecticola]|uniref:Acetyltransferase component of pyruvate dehydrogenase complex n=2 Tax=Caballeronia insecticola TaxID=758793 RepID=R4X4E5_9BURK|nr:dihydrolipoamide acetyltransferase [Caballeronia insecticola]
MPEVAANATHATLQSWLRTEGEMIEIGDCLAEIETDKAVVELTAEASGTMGRQLVRPGQDVEVGAPIGILIGKGESDVDIDRLLAQPASALHAATHDREANTERTEVSTPSPAAKADVARVFASPLARRLAVQHRLDIGTIAGSGPNGRVVKRDIERTLGGTPAVHAVVAVPDGKADAAATSAVPAFIEIPHSNMRRTIARRLSESKSTVPHFYLNVDCRMDRLLALRAEINAAATRKISINDFIVRAVAVALRDVPEANVGWTETALRRYRHADIAVAVTTETGLITPIVRAAESKTLSAISAEILDLAERARVAKLRPDEFQGGSFSISNLGMFGVAEFSAIINPPQAAILAVGAVQTVPVVDNGAVVSGQVLRCTLSVDHRAIDGALAAAWIAAFKRAVENPLSMLI